MQPRWSIIPAALIAVLVLASNLPGQPVVLPLDGNDTGRTFEGVGAASGGGAVARLLINYPEPQRSQILDLLFLPNFGASLQALKVEIGGDGNSTEGSEPSHMHRADDEDHRRGFEWWIMKEARRRNPTIPLHALAWDFPGWLKEANSQATADYLVKYVLGLKREHGLELDTLGIWNETKMDYAFIKTLRKTLTAHGLKTRIIADDLVNTWSITEAMAADPVLRYAVDVVATHYPRFRSTPSARAVGKPIWSSEDGPWGDAWGTAGGQSGPYAELLNRNYIEGRMTSTILWCLVSAYYDILDVPNAGLLRAATPWSGHFEVMSPIWVVAHTTHFAKPGWRYLDRACGLLPAGGSHVAIRHGEDYSVIVETLAATGPQSLEFVVQNGLSRGKVTVWRTNAQEWFERIKIIEPAEGRYTLELEPGSVYSLTTTTGQHKGMVDPPAASPFPLPFHDDFEKYPLGSTTPRFFIEQNGSYEVVSAGAGRSGKALRQVVNQSPIVWTYGHTVDLLGTASILGDKSWRNYVVRADVLLEEPGYGRVMGRVSRCTLDGQIAGYQLYLHDSGTWELRTATKGGVLATGGVPHALKTWHRLELVFRDDLVTARIDGRLLAEVRDGHFTAGMAGIGNGYNVGQYDNFEIKPVAPDVPVMAPPEPAALTNRPPTAPELYVPSPGKHSVRLSWSPIKGAKGYTIRYGMQAGKLSAEADAGPLTSFTVGTLTAGQTYHFVVHARRGSGESPASNAMSATPSE